MKLSTILFLIVICLLGCSYACAQSYDMRAISISCGGNNRASSTNFAAALTTSQTVAGINQSANYTGHFGFWHPGISMSLSVDDNDHSDPLLPDRFVLKQNYPNPFNPETEISFNLPVASHTKLEIFNILGKSVVMLVDEHMTAGQHSVHWFGKTDKGEQAASGIYFYKITAGDYFDIKKMVLIK